MATCQRNISQHCWAQHDHPVATCWVWLAQIWAKCCDMLGVGGSNLTTPTMTQHVATGWSNACTTTKLQHVAFKCCDRLPRLYAKPIQSFSSPKPPLPLVTRLTKLVNDILKWAVLETGMSIHRSTPRGVSIKESWWTEIVLSTT